MAKTSFVDFKAVKAAITMEQILEHYDLLDKFKRTGDSLNGTCPIHKGNNPTQFRISMSKNIWNCFSECKHGGNTLDFISEMENVTIHAAALKAIEWFKLDLSDMATSGGDEAAAETTEAGAPKPAVRKVAPVAAEKSVPNAALKFRLDKLERSHPYLIERGLTEESIIDFGMGFCSKGTMAGLIAIPIHNFKGEVVAYAGRFPSAPPEGVPKYKLPQGFRKSQELFNIDRAILESKENPLVIVEGFFDAIKLYQHGCRKVVALMGATMSAAQEELIRQHTTNRSHIIVMLDENEAGRSGRDDIACRLSKFCFVRVHEFEKPDMEPEQLTEEEVKGLFA